MLTSYIIDDEYHAIEILEKYIKRTPEIELIGFDQDPVNGLVTVQDCKPDLIFLDIDMPLLSGIEFANLIKGTCDIIFTTGSTEYAVEAYNKNISDYLLKPISYERFLNCVSRRHEMKKLSVHTTQQSEYFFIQSETKSKIVRINFDDITHVESLNNYVIIYHNNEKIISYIPLKELQQMLPNDRFSRVHKSFIVNNEKIKSIEGNIITLTDKAHSTVVIGTTFKPDFIDKIHGKTIKRHA